MDIYTKANTLFWAIDKHKFGSYNNSYVAMSQIYYLFLGRLLATPGAGMSRRTTNDHHLGRIKTKNKLNRASIQLLYAEVGFINCCVFNNFLTFSKLYLLS